MEKVIEIIKAFHIHFVLPSFLPGFEFCLRNKSIQEKYVRIPIITNQVFYLKAAYKSTLVGLCEYKGIKIPKSLKLRDLNFVNEFSTLCFPVLFVGLV
jgi:hypothetical protein